MSETTAAGLRTIGRHPSAVLLFAQLVVVLAYPFLDASVAGRAIIGVVQMAVSPDTGAIVLASAVFHVPFYFFVSYAMIRYLFEDYEITRDELFAVGAAFTVVAWAFAYLYAGAQVLWPGSFISYGTPDAGDPLPWFELLYLSFTTLTSVGLSDVYPVLDHSRALVMVEQVAGVLYVALVIARFVGLTKGARHR